MKSLLSSVVIALATLPATAGLTYDIHSTMSGAQASEQKIHATVDGKNLRLDFEQGDGLVFRNGAVAISHDGGTTLDVLDPQSKTYYEINLGAIAPPGMMDMLKLSNEKVSVKDNGDGGKLEGYATHHTTISAGADVAVGNMSTRLDVTMESWVTPKIPAESAAFLQHRGGSTGMPMLDKLIAAQSENIKGFPLKQVMNVKMANGGKTTVEMTSTTLVSNLKQTPTIASTFAMPPGFKQVPNPIEKLMGK